jgi:hypothetical protein
MIFHVAMRMRPETHSGITRSSLITRKTAVTHPLRIVIVRETERMVGVPTIRVLHVLARSLFEFSS